MSICRQQAQVCQTKIVLALDLELKSEIIDDDSFSNATCDDGLKWGEGSFLGINRDLLQSPGNAEH